MSTKKPVVVIDLAFQDMRAAYHFVEDLDPSTSLVRVGMELFKGSGLRIVESLHDFGCKVFLDLRLNDSPEIVHDFVSAAAKLDVWMLSIHSCGGPAMMKAARDAAVSSPTIIVGTVQQRDGFNDDISALGNSVKNCGLHGIACSAEVASKLSDDGLIHGIFNCKGHDFAYLYAKKSENPNETTPAGTYIIVGDPITQARHPNEAFRDFQEAMASS